MENQTGSNQNSAVVILSTLLLLAFGVIVFLLLDRSSDSQTITPSPITGLSASVVTSIPVTPTPANSKISLEKKYLFAINDRTGAKISEFDFVIKNVERTKEIDIPGGKATATSGRELLLINIELTNPGDIPASVVARNYLRLKVNTEDKLIAPEYHSDPVDLQPQSTKAIRLGFNISQFDTNLVLQVGELQGEKDILVL